ncbi:hypothetical protein OBBRIDRAFT_222021 [Obba rivulosa]|uniref:F-box domain-containing protein n=1 Tax=Obba rivulosa TaxID=1052685 RepID=A0A8E2DL57_9APHY|nr:hypothetical protein OBBRIDRAFT_222021 [Obba rivulosa]
MSSASEEQGASCIDSISLMALAQALKSRLQRDVKHVQVEGLENILLSSMMDVRDILNQRRPVIHRLPVELLRQIFYLVPRYETSSSDGLTLWTSPFLRRPDCIHLMKICRYWRRVVLDDSLIWNNVCNFTPPASLQEARHTEAILYLKSRPKHDLETVLYNDMEKIRELRWEHAHKLPATYLRAPAPILRSLAISAGRPSVYNALTEKGQKLFDGHTPSLRQLALHFVRSLPSNDFSNLSQLYLYRCTQIDPARLLAWLAASPRIEDLVLVGVSFSSEWDRNYCPTNDLHHFRRLAIKEIKEEDVAWLLTTPALTEETAVLLENVPLMAESETTVIPHYPATQNVTRLAIWHNYGSTFLMAVSPSTGLRQQSRVAPDGPSIHSQVLSRIPLINIIEFWCISMSVSGMDIDVRLLLTTMPALTTLVVDEIDLPRVISVLAPPIKNDRHAMQVACPNLTILHVVIWRHRDAQEILESLDALLTDRKRAGYPLERLILHSNPNDMSSRDPRGSFSGIKSEWRRHREWMSFNLEMPEVCARPAHRHWPAWSVFKT